MSKEVVHGQPFCLDILRRLPTAMGDVDVSLIDCLEVRVRTGVFEQNKPSGVWRG